MTLFRLGLRWVALLAFAVWFGGFTFYSAFVVPVVGEAMGPFDAGASVTREVTKTLNLVGVATLAVWWALVAAERRLGGVWPRRGRVSLVALNTALQVVLFAMHRVLDQRLATDRMTGFYRLHETYLIVSTVQWVACIGLIGVSLWIWQGRPAARSPES